MLYCDVVRLLDDIDFRLKAGLLGLIGDARITRAGMTTVRSAIQGILGPLQRAAVIDAFDIQIPVLDALSILDSARSTTDNTLITTARANRAVDVLISITYGPAVHRLHVTLQPKF
jgi:ABC-type Na+ transport system ATPase subunit NatA